MVQVPVATGMEATTIITTITIIIVMTAGDPGPIAGAPIAGVPIAGAPTVGTLVIQTGDRIGDIYIDYCTSRYFLEVFFIVL